MMRKCRAWCVLVFGLAFMPSLAAADQAIIRRLQIRGTQRALELETRAGEAFDLALVERDVRRLWATGWFDDITVETEQSPQGVDLAFALKEKARFYLRRVKFDRGAERFPVELQPGSALDAELAARLAGQLRRELIEQGYAEARVDASLVPAGFQKADLAIRVKRGPLYEVEEVRFTGSPGLPLKELRHALTATRARRVLPALGTIWGGWRLRAPFSQQRLESDLARLRSLYLSRGYFDARVEVGEIKIDKGKARIAVNVAAGPRYDARQVEIPTLARTIPLDRGETWFNQEFCRCLHQARSESEQRGEVNFSARIELAPAAESSLPHPVSESSPETAREPATPIAVRAFVEAGPVYHVGRIDFRGHRAVNDSTLRKALVLTEGERFDAGRLRRSLARLNRMAPLEPVDLSAVRVEPVAASRLVNITIPVRGRPRGYWALSGPLGPLSAFGPLHYTIGSRLPAVGSGPLELATYYATFSLAAWPLLSFPLASSRRWGAVLAFQRPYVPGARWQSGIIVAPQLGWRGTALAYGATHLAELTRSALGKDSVPAPPLPIPVSWRVRNSRDESRAIPVAVLHCDAPKPRLAWLRAAGGTLTDWAMSWLLTGAPL